MKILHAADWHLDSPFEQLNAEKAAMQRKAQRELLYQMAELAQTEGVSIVLLAGDLFDSAAAYAETTETLLQVFSGMSAEIFIAPGNHDYYAPTSPYGRWEVPENVHIFTKNEPEFFDLPALGVRVWGAAFQAERSEPILRGFQAERAENRRELMVLHGEVTQGASPYNPIRTEDIAQSGLDYLALGHIHAFSGERHAGATCYAWPGCPQGRGFDETGEKGVILAELGDAGCSLRFVPLKAREYTVISVDLTGAAEAAAAVQAAIPPESENKIARLLLEGEYDERPNRAAIEAVCEGKFFHYTIHDRSRPRRDLWEKAGEDSLRGLFLQKLRAAYEAAADEKEKERIVAAVRFGLAAIENREDSWF